MNAPVAHPEVARFVAAVRAQLDDLTNEEVEELTGGLEADLDDALADTTADEFARRLGDPASYAAELRASAGLPPRESGGGRPGRARVVALARSTRRTIDGAVARLRGSRWAPALSEYARALRPLWWVTRAWIAFMATREVFRDSGLSLPRSATAWVVFAALVVASIELGRRRASGGLRRLGPLIVVVNGVALLLIPVTLAQVSTSSAVAARVPVEQSPPPQEESPLEESTQEGGLRWGGEPVGNIFVYDASGRPLAGVQLFHEDGRPLTVDSEPGSEEYRLVPALDANEELRWNVYPLRRRLVDPDSGQLSGPLLAAPPPDLSLGPPLPETESESPEGLWFQGEPVRNVFAYDSAGRPLRQVRLFDQDGRPLTVTASGTPWWDPEGRSYLPVPAVDAQGQSAAWNVFPLRRRLFDDATGDYSSRPVDAPLPYKTVTALLLPPVTAASGTAPARPTAAPTPKPTG